LQVKMESYAGVDWASDKHDVLVADAAGEKLLGATFAHDEPGLRSLCRQLVRLNVTLVAIERPDGLLVERLLDAGLRVLALHPNQVAATRDRFRVSGGKSDRFDAFVLCELARTDHHRFRVLEPDSDQTKALRALTRAREDLVGMRTALGNQLRAELERFWPGPIGLFSDLHSQISLAFLERYPSPTDIRGLGEARMAAFLARERYSGGQTPSQLLAKLRRAPAGRLGEQELATRRGLVLTLVSMIKLVGEQIKELERQIATQVREHPDGPIFLSFFKGSVITAAELLAEIGDCRERYPTRDALVVWRRRPGRRRERVRQTQDRHVPLGLQQAAAAIVPHARRQHPPLAPLGARPLRRRTRTRPRPPPRAADRRARLVAHPLALLAEPRPIQPGPPPRAAAPRHRHHSRLVGPQARPRCYPADGRRLCHPQGRARRA
jgi:transposase